MTKYFLAIKKSLHPLI